MPYERKPYERTPLVRNINKKDVTINIRDIWRNPDIQDEVIKNVKKLSKK